MFLYLGHPTCTCLDRPFHDISCKGLCPYTFLIFSQVFYFSNTSIWFLPVRLPQNYSCRFNQKGLYYQILWLFLKRCWCLSPFSTLFPGFLPTFFGYSFTGLLCYHPRLWLKCWQSLGFISGSASLLTSYFHLKCSICVVVCKNHVLMTAKFISGLQASRYEPQL